MRKINKARLQEALLTNLIVAILLEFIVIMIMIPLRYSSESIFGLPLPSILFLTFLLLLTVGVLMAPLAARCAEENWRTSKSRKTLISGNVFFAVIAFAFLLCYTGYSAVNTETFEFFGPLWNFFVGVGVFFKGLVIIVIFYILEVTFLFSYSLFSQHTRTGTSAPNS